MIVEQLTFAVPRHRLHEWLELDAAVWNPMLAAQPGYRGKEVWITEPSPGAGEPDTGHPDTIEVQVIVRWTDLNSWKSVDTALLAATHASMGSLALASRETVHISLDAPAQGRGDSADAVA